MIPKIIHQSFIDKESIKKVKTYEYCQKKLLELHPDFEYRFYSDSDMENVMQENFPEYYECWTNLPKHIMKVDMFRYFIMYLYGGLYCDLDYLFLKKFDMLDKECILHEECAFSARLGTRNVDDCCIKILYANCIFSSRPKHDFWKFLMDNMKNIQTRIARGETSAIVLTGPVFLSEKYEEFEKKETIHITNLNLFNPKESFLVGRSSTQNEEIIKNKVNSIMGRLDPNCYGLHTSTTTWLSSRRKIFNL